MHIPTKKTLALFGLLCAAPVSNLFAQLNFNLAGRPVQVHSFASQGFAYTGGNNYVTMDTNKGSFAMTDGGANISTPLTDKFRVGAQVYVRRLGELSKWQVTLDWATADYRFAEWFGVRGGKVKTTLGLYNDTQDMDFLHTFAMMPQSMYPVDLRSSTIAHLGGDFYGDIRIKKAGTFSYTAYAGMRPDDPSDGYRYFLKSTGASLNPKTYTGRVLGGDLRWNTPVAGLVVGESYLTQHPHGLSAIGVYQVSRMNQISQSFVQYTKGNLRLDGEYRRDYRHQVLSGFTPGPAPGSSDPNSGPPPGSGDPTWNSRSWYTAAAYRISKRFEVGGYYSRFVPNWQNDHSANDNHIYDKVATVRFDIARYWNVKVEGHFMDGYGAMDSARGFYSTSATGTAAVRPKTNMLILRTGWNF